MLTNPLSKLRENDKRLMRLRGSKNVKTKLYSKTFTEEIQMGLMSTLYCSPAPWTYCLDTIIMAALTYTDHSAELSCLQTSDDSVASLWNISAHGAPCPL